MIWFTMIKIMPWVLLAILVFKYIPWRSIFLWKYGNNPKRAEIEVQIGNDTEICDGRLEPGITKKGCRYSYKCFGTWHTVIVPAKYPVKFLRHSGARQIRVTWGSPMAAPLGGEKDTDIPVGSDILDDIFRAHIGQDLAKTIFGKTVNFLMILIILAVVAFAGYFLFKMMNKNAVPANQPPGIEQPITPGSRTPLE